MVHTATLLLADPEATLVETDDGYWACSGVRSEALRRVVADADGMAAVRDRLVETAEDAVVVRLSATDRRGTIDVYRSATATRQLYTLRTGDGTTVLTDHFRNALAHLDPDERTVSRAAIADHLLFRSPLEPRTYVEGVHAVPHGAWVHWDGRADEWTTRVVDTLPSGPPIDPADAPARVDAALSAAFDARETERERIMFSGGVDSTLLGTYLDDARPLVMTVDSPEFSFESSYADRALDLLGWSADQDLTVAEGGFLDHLAASVEALGFPSHYNQTVVTDAVFRATADGQYVNGAGADALFGLTGTKGARVADWLAPLLSTRVGDALPDRVARPYRGLAATADRLDRSPADPDSFATRQTAFVVPSSVGDLLGPGLVADRARKQVSYVRRRVDRLPDGRFARQAELTHLLAYLRHNTVSQWRQLGYVHGTTLFTPFTTRGLTRCSRSIPAARRYVQGPGALGSLTAKCHLKSLLAERLPDYPVTQRKGAGSLPIERYVETGPLADVFERYDPPAFLSDAGRERHVESYSPLTWPLVTYAVWRDRVLRNPDLATVSGTRRRSVRLPTVPAAP